MERPWSTVAGLNWARRDRIPSPGPGQGKQLCAGIAGSVYSVGHGEAKTEIRAQIWTDGVKTLKRDVLTKRGIASCAIAIVISMIPVLGLTIVATPTHAQSAPGSYLVPSAASPKHTKGPSAGLFLCAQIFERMKT